MVSVGSAVSSGSTTDASTADSASADSSPAQVAHSTSERMNMDSVPVIDNDDSASDVSMCADSEDEDDAPTNASAIQVNPVGQTLDGAAIVPGNATAADASKKRKFSSHEAVAGDRVHNETSKEDRKRIKPADDAPIGVNQNGAKARDMSLLPAEIWHRIFTFCPPRVLGSLWRVNKSFRNYLDPSSPSSPSDADPLPRSASNILKADDIWRASRLLFRPGMPGPLTGRSEHDMWKLACGIVCQFCGKKNQPNSIPMDQWHPGPGENGVRPIWLFGFRSCGPCLRDKSVKEIDLLLSSSIPSPLMAALPFIFLTNELHVLPPATLQGAQHPRAIQITKCYDGQQVEDIKQEFESVKAMGSATVEEWIKGLDTRGKERRSDAARWEKWEVSGGVARMLKSEKHEVQIAGGHVNGLPAKPLSVAPPSLYQNGTTQVHQAHHTSHTSTQFSNHLNNKPPAPTPQNHSGLAVPARYDSPAQNGFAHYPPRAYPPARHERTKEEVIELKAARRAEIERRCMLLDPPLTAGVLAHMASFQAAIQIIQPLNDGAWEVLMPRLLSQREEAEQREVDRLAQTRVVQERSDVQARSDSKELVDREWDDIQAPLRARIGGYADETIRDGWNGGDKVTSENCPRFAAEVLIYVRKRFYAEVAKDEAAVRATGREPELDPPNGPFTRKLILENMKWVFDTKIKPHTETYRKEIFLCSACEYASKYYGFEGVIQHYAAKHTSALSVGSVVVHWKSEWPENPPFNPDPTSVKPYYGPAQSASAPYVNPASQLQQNYGYGGYQPAQVPAPIQTPNPHIYQESPAPYYGHPQFGDQYSGHQNGPYAPPPQPYVDSSHGYQAQQYSVAPQSATMPGYHDPSQDYTAQGFGGSYPASTQSMYGAPQPIYPVSTSEGASQQAYDPHSGHYGSTYNQQNSYQSGNFVQVQQAPPQMPEEYKSQLADLARNAREIWNTIHGIKEVPGSVKVFTIIHHILQRFRESYQDDPPLSMIVEGLHNNKDMRPVRNVNGLVCRACSLNMPGSRPAPQKKHFSFPQLVNHFHSIHEGVSGSSYLPDWTKDMVELPDQSKLSSIVNLPGLDNKKLKLFTDAIPEILSRPASYGIEMHNGYDQHYESTVEPTNYSHLAPSQDNHEKFYTNVDNGKPLDTGSVAYDSGEYDPRHPHDLLVEHRPLRKASDHHPRERESIPGAQSPPRYARRDVDFSHDAHHSRSEHAVLEQKPTSPPLQSRPIVHGSYMIRDEAPIYRDRQTRYRHADEIEYRMRRERPVSAYERSDFDPPTRNYRAETSQSYQSNQPIGDNVGLRDAQVQPLDDAVAQQNRIFEVVAQISQQAQQAQQFRARQPVRNEPNDGGSEDGELRAKANAKPEVARKIHIDEASNAAERFLNNFLSEPVADFSKSEIEQRRDPEMRTRWEAPVGFQHRIRSMRDIEERPHGRLVDPAMDEPIHNGYIVRERVPLARQSHVNSYENQYASTGPEPEVERERSPELVDRRYKLNNVVYRDERQSSHGTHRTPSRYARYESVRLENDRARSRSPVYVKMGQQPGQYRERSPGAHPLNQEPVHHSRTPQPLAEIAYERPPARQEYYKVYADEPRPREPQFVEAFEYVRVADPQGDYMIRRPVRRGPEPVYARYEDEVYSQPPIYESRAPTARPDPVVYEEYDPRHPEPPPAAPHRQVRYLD